MKILLTDRYLRSLKPTGRRQIIWDSAVPGFAVKVTAKGRIAFIAISRLPGKRTPITREVGPSYPLMALSPAREAARQALLDITRGIDPAGKKAAERLAEAHRQASSFASAAEEFIARHVRKLRSADDIERTIRRELIPRWHGRPIAEITRRDVLNVAGQITDSGRLHTADKLFRLTSKMFNWCVARGVLEASPCAGIRIGELTGRREPRQRVLSDAELRALWQATEGLGYPAAPFVRTLLVTGQRLREVANAKWAEFDLGKALWTIPPERMKGDAAHEVPLPPMAVDILKSLPCWSGGYVFSTTGGKRPISGFSKMKLRLDAAMNEPVAPWRFHDLRRTMRTGLGGLPVPNNIAELCIAHAQPGLHKVYDQHGYRNEKRRALELWAARLRSIVELEGPGKIVKLRAT